MQTNWKPAFLMIAAVTLLISALMLGRNSTESHQSKRRETILASSDSPATVGTPVVAAVVIASTEAVNENLFDTSSPHAENGHSFRSLAWTFGGKNQRGWQLYVPLISGLIETSAPPTSVGFAAAVATWQGKVGLRPTGVMDEETLMTMVKTWQEVRSKDRTLPTPEQLTTAPATEFYDPLRDAALRQVERRTYEAYKRLLRAAIAEPSLNFAATSDGALAPTENRLRIVSAYRSREHQERLRRLSPGSGRAGLAVNSPHFTGRALDLYIAGEPVETKDANRALQVETPVYKWLVKHAGDYGFRPYFYEPWHWEYDPTLDPARN